MQNGCSLIQLFQNINSTNGHPHGYEYKVGDKDSVEINPSYENIHTLYDGILAYIHNNNHQYFTDLKSGDEDFDATSYSYPVFEKIRESMIPIIVDMRFKFINSDKDEPLYNRLFIYKCVYILQDIIMGLFRVEGSDDDEINKNLLCFFMETEPWTDGEYKYVNLRFQFPYSKINIEYLNKLVISNFRKVLTEENIIKNYVNETPVDPLNFVIPYMEEYVCIYGSKNKQTDAPYQLKSCYSFIEDCDHVDTTLPEYNLPFFYNFVEDNTVSFLENSLVVSNLIDKNELLDDKFFNLPLILSVHFTNKILKVDDKISISNISIDESKTKKEKPEVGSAPSKDQYSQLLELIELISPSRFTSYYKYDWITIGKAIYNICNGRSNGLALWQQYTNDVELKSLCSDIYDDFNSQILDIRTIKSYASVDNKDKYQEWMNNRYSHKLQSALSAQSLDVADLISEILELEFVYDRVNEAWYHFNGTRLVVDRKAYVFINYIVAKDGKVQTALNEYRQFLIKKSNENNDRTNKQVQEMSIKKVSELLYKLADLNYIKRIVEACQVYMFDDNLYVNTDENLMTMACKDCVIECYDESITVRPGRLQDYITKCTNISFPITYGISHPKVQFILKYLGQVHTDNQLCHFFIKHLSSFLIGGNLEKFFINWIGEANASKSQLLKFIQAALGEYCVIIPNHIITLNINSNTGKPEPALERAKGARVGFAAETDRTEKWHVGNIKKFTGNDVYFNRTLNKEGCERVLSWVLIAMSNVVNDAPNADEAYFVREVIIPFLSKWVDNAPASIEEQYAQRRFPMDLDFGNKIKNYGQAMLFVQYYFYPTYRKEGIRILPDLVKRATMKHQRDLDVIFNFIHSKLQMVFVGDPKDKVPDSSKKSYVSELHGLYKRWYRAAYGNDVIPLDEFKFRDEMARRIGAPDDNGLWCGIIPKQLENASLL